MNDNKDPDINNDAVLGKTLLRAYTWPSRKLDDHFPKTSKTIHSGASKSVGFGIKCLEAGKNLASNTVDFMARKVVGKTAVTTMAYTAATTILSVRALMGIWDFLLDWFLKPIGKGLQKTLPGPTRLAKKSYESYTGAFKKIGYPNSIYAMIGLGAATAAGTIWGTLGTKELLYAQYAGQHVPNAAAWMTAYTFVPKLSKVFVFKPALITFKTTRDGFFDSDLYKDKLKPAYERNVQPVVDKTQRIIHKVDKALENTPTPYKMVKEILADQEKGGIYTQAKDIADNALPNLRNKFQKASHIGRKSVQRVKNTLGITPYSQIRQASRLDEHSASPDFDKAHGPVNQQNAVSTSKNVTLDQDTAQDRDLV